MKTIYNYKYIIISFLFLSILAACGSGLDGTYSNKNGNISMTFKSGGKVHYVSDMVSADLKYKINGKKLIVYDTESPIKEEWTMKDDGSLVDDLFGMKKLVKVN